MQAAELSAAAPVLWLAREIEHQRASGVFERGLRKSPSPCFPVMERGLSSFQQSKARKKSRSGKRVTASACCALRDLATGDPNLVAPRQLLLRQVDKIAGHDAQRSAPAATIRPAEHTRPPSMISGGARRTTRSPPRVSWRVVGARSWKVTRRRWPSPCLRLPRHGRSAPAALLCEMACSSA
jgi:hypothetical protein